jgi:hypothetical protein
MLKELLFHLAVLTVITLITILPFGYLLERHKHKGTGFLYPRTRRDIIWLWVLPSASYLGYIAGEHSMTFISRILVGLALIIAVGVLTSFPSVIKQPTGWIKDYKKWLEYPQR